MENIPQVDTEEEVVEDSVESTEFKPNQALDREKTLLERFSGKAKKIARVMALVSALSAVPVVTQEAYAQENKDATKVEKVEKEQEEKIDMSKVTEASKWSKDMLEQAKSDLNEIKTADDADYLARDIFKIYAEYYLGIKTKEYTNDDRRFVLQNVKGAVKLLGDLNKKFPVHGYEHMVDCFSDVVKHLNYSLSYAGKKDREMLKKLDTYIKK
jgi:hypothetical protein